MTIGALGFTAFTWSYGARVSCSLPFPKNCCLVSGAVETHSKCKIRPQSGTYSHTKYCWGPKTTPDSLFFRALRPVSKHRVNYCQPGSTWNTTPSKYGKVLHQPTRTGTGMPQASFIRPHTCRTTKEPSVTLLGHNQQGCGRPLQPGLNCSVHL